MKRRHTLSKLFLLVALGGSLMSPGAQAQLAPSVQEATLYKTDMTHIECYVSAWD